MPVKADLTRFPWVIFGCGYTGTRLARRLLAAGAQVWATRQSAAAAATLVAELGEQLVARPADLADAQTLAGWLPTGAVIVDAAPPALSSTAGEANLVAAARTAAARRIVYISSTGVYPAGDGSWVDEQTPVGPASDRGKARLAAETAVLEGARDSGIEAVTLRVAGIYGPGRGVPTRMNQGNYRIIGAGDTYVSRIHVDDLVTVIAAAGTVAALARSVYNVADDEPETSRVYADAVAEILGVPTPPSVPVSAVDPWVATMMRANRRIANGCIKRELGVELAYPTWREGLVQVMREERIPDAAQRAKR